MLKLSAGFSGLDRWARVVFKNGFNPFGMLGALAVTNIVIALVSGILLLPFYSVSVHGAYSSVEAMLRDHPFTTGLLHSIHRYSSDAAIFLSLLHLARMFGIRAFHGARNLSWQTGLLALGLLWFIGWTGYWLVWDQHAFLVARLSARMIDSIPIFGTFLGRGLLLDSSINNQVFFVVFFVHMIVPLALFLTLWIHVSRVNRPIFITNWKTGLAVVGVLLAYSIAYPGLIDPQANAFRIERKISGDFFYTLPVFLFQKASTFGIWASFIGSYLLAAAIPWLIRTKKLRAPSFVKEEDCTECMNCFHDCPYQAIEMVPRQTPHPKYATTAWVNPERCVSCGICNGSCDQDANRLPALSTPDIENRIREWAPRDGSPAFLLFACKDVTGGVTLNIPDYRVIEVICSGHVNPKSLKLALNSGFKGVLIASSLPGACRYREGDDWIRQRVNGERKPFGGLGSTHRSKIRIASLGHGDLTSLAREARAFAAGGPVAPVSEEV